MSIDINIESRIIHFNQMVPCKTAFIDARTPGSDKKENFCLIGEGVAENPDQIVHITIPHGFNIGAARQPKGCKNSHHSHDTEEVFMIQSGKWQFTWGEDGSDGQVTLTAGDIISLPSNMFRGFENIGDEPGFMFSILSLNDSGSAGKVMWAPYVFEQAENHGLVLLEDGRLIDIAAGIKIPDNGVVMQATTKAEAASLDKLTLDELSKGIVSDSEVVDLKQGGLSAITGVTESAIIGIANPAEEFDAAKISWPHGFQLRDLQLQAGASTGDHTRSEEEVIIVQKGELSVSCSGENFTLGEGDLFTAPIDSIRQYQNISDTLVQLWVVRRGNQPRAAQFV